MKAPEISVVMGVYNNADTLSAALSSILSQERVDLEFIVVDDGSTDGSAEILDAIARKDLRLKVVHKQNEGLTRALIDGCAMASAPWIARQDADDVSLPGRLKAQWDRARQADAPDMVVCAAVCRSPEGAAMYEVYPPLEADAAREKILEHGETLCPHGAILMCTDSYKAAGGYREQFYFAQDLDLVTRLAERGRIAAVAQVLYAFRFSPVSISGQLRHRQEAFRRLVREGHAVRITGNADRRWLEEAEALSAKMRAAPSRFPDEFVGLYFIGGCLRKRDSGLARSYFARAVRARPWSVSAILRWMETTCRSAASPGFRPRLLVGAAAGIRRLPNFRGKVRALLALHRILGLESRHIVVPAMLHHPVRYRVNLDLFCLHERMAYFMDRYEPGTVEFLARLWREGEPFVDVGANVGLIAIPFTLLCGARSPAREGSANRLLTYCVEAVAGNAQSLAGNIAMNGLDAQMQVVATAVGECEKQVEIQVEKNQKAGTGTGTANILAAGSDYSCERIPLHVTTIDRLVVAGRLPGNCGLIKIDTDGYDLFALMGARELLARARPIVYGEFMAHCLQWHGQTIHDVQAYLRPFRYKVFIRSEGWTFVPLKSDSPYVQDALCVPEEKCERASGCIACPP